MLTNGELRRAAERIARDTEILTQEEMDIWGVATDADLLRLRWFVSVEYLKNGYMIHQIPQYPE